MANRPAWSYDESSRCLIRNTHEFVFNAGFSVTQKQKNIVALHESIGKKALEVSTKSLDELGIKLSAFNLKLNGVPLENVFQSSKKYENGGPYLDLLRVHPREAKRDERHHSSGRLIAFEYDGCEYPLNPKTIFYDYIYLCAVIETLDKETINKVMEYQCFTDIEFNPNKSINCQAKTVAILKAFLSMYGEMPDIRGRFDEFVKFYKIIKAEKA